jgi:putative drug exporter of the RND superfamily
MFRTLGNTVVKAWPLLLLAWVALLFVTSIGAPAWDKVVKDGQFAFLPPDAPSRQGEELFKKAFPDEYFGSTVVVALSREDREILDTDRQFISQILTPRLDELAIAGHGEAIVSQILTSEDTDAGVLLISPDKKATLVVVELTTEFLDRSSALVADQVEELIGELQREGQIPAGLEVGLTGSATLGRDTRRAEDASARAVERWTILVVVALLLLLYRAPLLALIPLTMVYFAVQISLNVLALLAQSGLFDLFREVRIYVTVLVYGAGVDYCLFLIARYKEELEGGAGLKEGVAEAVHRVGAALTASAGTVIAGIAMMIFARFGKIHLAGIAIPLSLLVVLLGALSFTPSLLAITGRWAFWPHAFSQEVRARHGWLSNSGVLGGVFHRDLMGKVWERLGEVLRRRPGSIWLVTAAVMAPFAAIAAVNYHRLNYDPISELPPNAPSASGTHVLEKYFAPGVMGPVMVFIKNSHVDFGTDKGVGLVAKVTSLLKHQKDALGLADVRSIAEPLGITPARTELLARTRIPRETIQEYVRKQGLRSYVSRSKESEGHVTRLELLLALDPFSPRAIENLGRIETAIRTGLPQDIQDGSEVAVSGATAGLQDLQTIAEGDLRRMEALVPIVVFGVLVMLLRRPIVSIYLVLSVLFGYLATWGATFAVFSLFYRNGFAGLHWSVPILLFTILVAVGEDYNIFLMTRIQEEQERRGPLAGIAAALSRTGRIISSCGFIMAGTFASLLSGALLSMRELGFALAAGVLLDTLVVRPILVPTFLILLDSGNLNPFGAAREAAPKLAHKN